MAGLDGFRVVVAAGRGNEAGVVVRLPGVLIVARSGRPETAETARRLLDLCAEVVAESGTAPNADRRALARRVAGLLAAADPDQVPDFALLTTVGQRIAAMVHGAMDVVAAGTSPLALSGIESATWVDRLLPDGITQIDVGPSGAAGAGHDQQFAQYAGFPLDLRVGAVPGVGASLLPPARDAAPLPVPKSAADDLLAGYGGPREPATAAERIPLPTERAPEQQSSVPPALAPLLNKEEQAHRARSGAEPTQAADYDELADDYHEDPPTELAAPSAVAGGRDVGAGHTSGELTDEHEALTQLPGQTFTVSDLIDDSDAPTMLPTGNHAQVEGVLCAKGHFNDPKKLYCAECGESLPAGTDGRSVWRPRPPVGVLVFDDGQTVPVDIDLVIGRQPDRDDAVRNGTARALPVEDGESAVSRVHAVITLNGWDAVITDRGSANGTYIAPPEATVWTPLEPFQPAPLVPGTRVQVGKRTFVFNNPVNA